MKEVNLMKVVKVLLESDFVGRSDPKAANLQRGIFVKFADLLQIVDL